MSPDWIAVDWGTSRLRAWAMGPDGVIEARASDQGMAALDPDGFEPALLALCDGWVDGPTTVIACGMVGARQGWAEAPYASVPCTVAPPPPMISAPTRTPGLSVHILPGLSQANPPDVMRGEETQAAGFLALHKDWDGILCLPGTHTKWVHVSAGEVVSFQTFMTGDLFAAITGQTVLKHSVGVEGWDDDAFNNALDETLSRPERLATRLFGIRAEGLLGDLAPHTARARLSGLLLGCELAAARPYWLGQQVAIIGSGRVAKAYAAGLARQGVPTETMEAEGVTLAGLSAAYHRGVR